MRLQRFCSKSSPELLCGLVGQGREGIKLLCGNRSGHGEFPIGQFVHGKGATIQFEARAQEWRRVGWWFPEKSEVGFIFQLEFKSCDRIALWIEQAQLRRHFRADWSEA